MKWRPNGTVQSVTEHVGLVLLAAWVTYGDVVLVVKHARCRPPRIDVTHGDLDVLVVSPAIDHLRDGLVVPIRRDVTINLGLEWHLRVVVARLPCRKDVLYLNNPHMLEYFENH